MRRLDLTVAVCAAVAWATVSSTWALGQDGSRRDRFGRNRGYVQQPVAGSESQTVASSPSGGQQNEVGNETQKGAQNEPAKPEAKTSVPAAAGPLVVKQPVVVKKPVVSEEAVGGVTTEGVKQASAEGKTEQKADEKAPLHQHPTLLGMLRRNNDWRSRIGLRPHRMSPSLTAAAQDHANYMARTRDFNHYSNLGPAGRAVKYGFRGGVLENIAWGYVTIDSAFDGWRFSGGHWANMTSNTTDAGFGYAVSPDGTGYWVAVYGTDPNPVEEAPAKEPEVKQALATEPTAEKTK